MSEISSISSVLTQTQVPVSQRPVSRQSTTEAAMSAESGNSVVKIMDSSTKEVIHQIPSEERLKLSQSIDKFQQGLLLNGQA